LVLIERPAINLTKRSFEPIGLSPRQSEILFYIVQGYENPEIATLLHLHPTTIKTNITNITRKLKASGRLEAVTIGLKKLGIEIMTYVLP
jgi:DNA-binding CsgD family transcriptional regulator